jgi:hypothetical protein
MWWQAPSTRRRRGARHCGTHGETASRERDGKTGTLAADLVRAFSKMDGASGRCLRLTGRAFAALSDRKRFRFGSLGGFAFDDDAS